MKSDVEKDLSDSAYDFLRLVYPKLKELNFLAGEVVPTETVTSDQMVEAFDQLAGIDAWIIKDNIGITGLASRIQWYEPERHPFFPFNSFTIRKSRYTGAKTEYEKRTAAINSKGEFLFPYLTCQAYIVERRTGDLISMAIARTVDIFQMIIRNRYEQRKNRDGNYFYAVFWEGMKVYNLPIKTWPEKTEGLNENENDEFCNETDLEYT